MNDLCVLGLGYIGLPTASIFATKGKRVLGVDDDVVGLAIELESDGKSHVTPLGRSRCGDATCKCAKAV